MPRLLTKRKLVFLFGMVLLIMAVEWVTIAARPGFSLPILVFDSVALAMAVVDIAAYRRLGHQFLVFGAQGHIRNADCLVIGEPCVLQDVLPSGCDSYVQVELPKASVRSCGVVLKRTYSILSEGGEVFFVTRRKNKERERITAFDTFAMHPVTIDEYGVRAKWRARKAIAVLHPIECMRLLSGMRLEDLREENCDALNDCLRFCGERGISLRLLVG